MGSDLVARLARSRTGARRVGIKLGASWRRVVGEVERDGGGMADTEALGELGDMHGPAEHVRGRRALCQPRRAAVGIGRCASGSPVLAEGGW